MPAGWSRGYASWKDHQDRVALVFGDLSDPDQIRLLDISHQLTHAFRRHLAGLATPGHAVHNDDPDVMLIRNNRRVRPPRPQAPTG